MAIKLIAVMLSPKIFCENKYKNIKTWYPVITNEWKSQINILVKGFGYPFIATFVF